MELVTKKIRLPNSLRVISEMHMDENFMCWLIIISHLQIISRSIMKNSVSSLYAHRIKLLCKWVLNDVPPDLAVTRSLLSNWEACTAVFGPVIRAGISAKKVIINGLTNNVAPDPVSFSYTHKFAGSAVAVSIIASSFISANVYGDMPGFKSGLEPIIEQIHTVQRVPNPLLSKFPIAYDVFKEMTDEVLSRKVQAAVRLISESECNLIEFQSLAVSIYHIMQTTR